MIVVVLGRLAIAALLLIALAVAACSSAGSPITPPGEGTTVPAADTDNTKHIAQTVGTAPIDPDDEARGAHTHRQLICAFQYSPAPDSARVRRRKMKHQDRR
jgi:hypothetical protein